MKMVLYGCPRCGQSFHFGDGFPDLFGLRLCSYACREAWLEERHYQGVEDAPECQPVEIGEQRQMGSVDEKEHQIVDLERTEGVGRQME